MKTLLKIDIDDNGLSFIECNLETELEVKRLISSFLTTMTQNTNFKDAMLASVALILHSSEEVEKLAKVSVISAQTKIFGGEDKKTKN